MTVTCEPLSVVVLAFFTRSDLAMEWAREFISYPLGRWGSPVPLYKSKITNSLPLDPVIPLP